MNRRVYPLCLAGCLLLSGCGGMGSMDMSSPSTGSAGGGSATASSGGGMGGMYMGDANATRADKVPGADLRTASFAVLQGAPADAGAVKGTAWMALSDKGTTVTVELTGLKPGTSYLALLHGKACSDDRGGDTFRFDRNGMAMPPNEIHLQFTAEPSGRGFMTAENKDKASDAKSVVLSTSGAEDTRLACADL
jgi:hypothetical protein